MGCLQCRPWIQVTAGTGLAWLWLLPHVPRTFPQTHWWAWQDHVKSPIYIGEPPRTWREWALGPWLLSQAGSSPVLPGPEAGLTVLQMHLLEGSVGVRGSLAYVPQQAWIIGGSVRENILMGGQYDKAR